MLPYLTRSIAPIPAKLKVSPEDFEVVEIPAYSPSGEGEHVFAWIEKRGLSTRDAVQGLCEALGVDLRDAGWAGLKDRQALTRQWISLAGTSAEAVSNAEVEGVRVLEAAHHPQKLRTGHLKANRFTIRLRDFDPARMNDAREALSLIERRGLPNYYGEQRFGRAGDNARRALSWVRGEERAPRSPFHRKLQMSALQSELFNRFVADRVETSTLDQVSPGELAKKHATGGVFVVEDAEEAQRRAEAWEISATGPIFGAKMRWPQGQALEKEQRLLADAELTLSELAKWKRIGPGTRRFVRVPVSGLRADLADRALLLEFTLPAGSYATILVREVLKGDAPSPESG